MTDRHIQEYDAEFMYDLANAVIEQAETQKNVYGKNDVENHLYTAVNNDSSNTTQTGNNSQNNVNKNVTPNREKLEEFFSNTAKMSATTTANKDATNNTEKEKVSATPINAVNEQAKKQTIDTSKMSAEQKEFLRLMNNPANLSNLSDAEIKKLYKELKEKYYQNKQDKKQFKKINKNVKAMIKSDKKRTSLRHIKKAGKYVAILGIVGGSIKAFIDGFDPIYPSLDDLSELTLDDHIFIMQFNLDLLHNYSPTGEALLLAGGLGVVAYAGAKTAIKVQDLKTLRRLTCKILAEDLDVSDAIRLKKVVKEMGINDVRDFYPLAELCAPEKLKKQQAQQRRTAENDKMEK